MVSLKKRILRIRVLFVHLGPCYPQTRLKAPYLSLLEVLNILLELFIYLKIAEPNVQKLDESNEIYTDNPMWMIVHAVASANGTGNSRFGDVANLKRTDVYDKHQISPPGLEPISAF